MYNLVDADLEKKMDETLHFVSKNLLETGHNPKPVLLHSFKIAMTLYILKYSEEIVISGILHDLIEDTDVQYEQIKEKFGVKVADIVNAVSFDPKIKDKTEQAKKLFEHCCDFGYEALIVKASDLLDNINFVNLVEDNTIRLNLLKKYEMFLEMSKNTIGEESIYGLLKDKVNIIKGLNELL